jgi:hypothetical protein
MVARHAPMAAVFLATATEVPKKSPAAPSDEVTFCSGRELTVSMIFWASKSGCAASYSAAPTETVTARNVADRYAVAVEMERLHEFSGPNLIGLLHWELCTLHTTSGS